MVISASRAPRSPGTDFSGYGWAPGQSPNLSLSLIFRPLFPRPPPVPSSAHSVYPYSASWAPLLPPGREHVLSAGTSHISFLLCLVNSCSSYAPPPPRSLPSSTAWGRCCCPLPRGPTMGRRPYQPGSREISTAAVHYWTGTLEPNQGKS